MVQEIGFENNNSVEQVNMAKNTKDHSEIFVIGEIIEAPLGL